MGPGLVLRLPAEEQKFENPALLVEQIANDQKRAAQLLAAYDRGDMDDLSE